MPGSQDVKLNVTPHQCYLLIMYPTKEQRSLYREESENKGNCRVSPNAFPYMTLNLDQDGDILERSTPQRKGIRFQIHGRCIEFRLQQVQKQDG